MYRHSCQAAATKVSKCHTHTHRGHNFIRILWNNAARGCAGMWSAVRVVYARSFVVLDFVFSIRYINVFNVVHIKHIHLCVYCIW